MLSGCTSFGWTYRFWSSGFAVKKTLPIYPPDKYVLIMQVLIAVLFEHTCGPGLRVAQTNEGILCKTQYGRWVQETGLLEHFARKVEVSPEVVVTKFTWDGHLKESGVYRMGRIWGRGIVDKHVHRPSQQSYMFWFHIQAREHNRCVQSRVNVAGERVVSEFSLLRKPWAH